MLLKGKVSPNGRKASKPLYNYNGELTTKKRKFFIVDKPNYITGKVENNIIALASKLAESPQNAFQAIGDNNRKNLAILDFIMQADFANRQRITLEYNESLKELRRLLAYFNLPLEQASGFTYKNIPKN